MNARIDLAMYRTETTPDRVAIDGPSASGKSTVGQMLADRWGYRFLDTGIMYRCVTHCALQREVDLSDDSALGSLAESLDFRLRPSMDGASDLTVCGRPIGDELYSDAVTASISRVSAVGAVRVAMVAQQRQVGDAGAIVMAGRDIGTVVMPDAPLKVYLDASASARAQRRYAEMQGRDGAMSYDEILAAIELRDRYDSSREHSPLMRADDAKLIDTDALTASEVVDSIVAMYSNPSVTAATQT